MVPRIALLITTYNGEKVICDALDSVLRQHRPPDELIIVDDGSADSTCERIEDWSRKTGYGLRLHRLDRNRYKRQFYGPALPRRVGIGLARADVVAYLDQDDLVEPEHTALLASGLEQNPDLVVCFGDMRVVDQTGTMHPSFLAMKEMLAGVACEEGTGGIRRFRHSAYGSLLAGSYIPTCAVLFRKSAVEAIGGVNPDLGGVDDWDLWLRLSRVGRFGYFQTVLGTRRVHNYNLSHNHFQYVLTRHRVLKTASQNPHLLGLTMEELQATRAQLSAEMQALLYHASREGIRTYWEVCREVRETSSSRTVMTPRDLARALVFSPRRHVG